MQDFVLLKVDFVLMFLTLNSRSYRTADRILERTSFPARRGSVHTWSIADTSHASIHSMLDTEKVRWYSPHTLRKSVEQVRRRLSSVPLSVGGFGGRSAQPQMEQSEN